MSGGYDVIVVGARCAGSPTAMLLARKGYRVLVVDRAAFPSDTMSTHLVHNPGVAALARWGILDRLGATGCPPITRYTLDVGSISLSGTPRLAPGAPAAFSPRRTVLDKLLADAAMEAGAELRERFVVDSLVWEDGRVAGIRGHAVDGGTVTERALLVVGADGVRSLVAQLVDAPTYHERPPLTVAYYAYWRGVASDGLEVWARPGAAWGAFPTHDGLTCIPVSWPASEFRERRRDIEGALLHTLELAPEFADRVRSGRRETRFVGSRSAPNFFRKPFGDGWALVGDAGYHKDPITGQGISDAFRDAELLAGAVDACFGGGRPFAEAMAAYERARNAHALAMYDFTCGLATLDPPPPDVQEVLGAVYGNPAATDDFVSVMAGTLRPDEFFAPANVARILAGSQARLAS